MSKITLRCKQASGLHLGPGLPSQPNAINFQENRIDHFGYAEVDEDDPLFKEKMSWVNGPGCPHIEIIDEQNLRDELPRPIDPDDEQCPGMIQDPAEPNYRSLIPCAFRGDEREVNAHLLSHRKGS
jgi:hypothetical protein